MSGATVTGEEELFGAAGGLAELYARRDWAATALGPVTARSLTLRRSLRRVLDTG